MEKRKQINYDNHHPSEEEAAAGRIYEDILALSDEKAQIKATHFVRGKTFNAGSGEEKSTSSTGKQYIPPKCAQAEKKIYEKSETPSKKIAKSSKTKVKPKSNLDALKEELQATQKQREERHRLKSMLKDEGDIFNPVDEDISTDFEPRSYRTNEDGDPNTTNLYLGNIHQNLTERDLCEIFGKYGPLASVKIMYPRSAEERVRENNFGFVAYMCRKDSERAFKNLNRKKFMDVEMKLGWAKAVFIPPQPVYIPPAMMELIMPPPPSGLPFNAQPGDAGSDGIPRRGDDGIQDDELQEVYARKLKNTFVKVVIPNEREMLLLIHRMVEFVVREGPMFEAIIMHREFGNPMFQFLFDNQSPSHVYYRWRLFSVLQGDDPSEWRTKTFQMFENGSLWKPPSINPYLQGMPEELVDALGATEPRKGELSKTQRDLFEDMIRNLKPERCKIAEAMIYCIEHADAAEEIIDCITQSLSIPDTPLHKKVARLYLISDVLHNCGVKIANASLYREGFKGKLFSIFSNFRDCFQNIEGRMEAERFKKRVNDCFRAWDILAIYPNSFLIQLQNEFLGLGPLDPSNGEGSVLQSGSTDGKQNFSDSPIITEDIDGIPMEDENMDGIPMADEDIDGIPIFNVDGGCTVLEDAVPFSNESNIQSFEGQKDDCKPYSSNFKRLKWEPVDPIKVKLQAMTSSKWDLLEENEQDCVAEELQATSSSKWDLPEQVEQEECVEEDVDGQPIDDPTELKVPRRSQSISSEESTRISKKEYSNSGRRSSHSRDVRDHCSRSPKKSRKSKGHGSNRSIRSRSQSSDEPEAHRHKSKKTKRF